MPSLPWARNRLLTGERGERCGSALCWACACAGAQAWRQAARRRYAAAAARLAKAGGSVGRRAWHIHRTTRITLRAAQQMRGDHEPVAGYSDQILLNRCLSMERRAYRTRKGAPMWRPIPT